MLLLALGKTSLFAQILVSSAGSGSIAQYDLQTGALINPNFISGLNGNTIGDLVVYGQYLFVGNGSYISQYNAGTGASITPTFVAAAPLVGGSLRAFSLQVTPSHLFLLAINPTGMGSNGEVLRWFPTDIAPFLVAGMNSNGLPTLLSFAVIGQNMWTSDVNGNVSKWTNVYSNNVVQTAQTFHALRLTSDGTNVYGGFGTNIFKLNGTTGQMLNPSFITTAGSINAIAYLNGILYVANGSNISTYDPVTGNLLNAQFITGTSNVFGIALAPGPNALQVELPGSELVFLFLQYPTERQDTITAGLPNNGSWVFPTTVIGPAQTQTLTVRNIGAQALTNLAVSIDGTNAADFTVTQQPVSPVTPGNTTTFTVQFQPTSGASSIRSAALHLTGTANSFNFNLSGQALSFTSFTGGDGMSDAAKFLNSALGFDWTMNQQALVNAYYANASASGLYTTAQVQSMNVNTPLLQRDPSTGRVTLTLTLQTTSSLNQSFSTLPFNTAGSTMTIDGQGRLLFSFPTSGNSQLFLLEAQ